MLFSQETKLIEERNILAVYGKVIHCNLKTEDNRRMEIPNYSAQGSLSEFLPILTTRQSKLKVVVVLNVVGPHLVNTLQLPLLAATALAFVRHNVFPALLRLHLCPVRQVVSTVPVARVALFALDFFSILVSFEDTLATVHTP